MPVNEIQSRERLISWTRQVVMTGEICKSTHQEIHNNFLTGPFAEVRSRTEAGRRRYPIERQHFIDGYFKCLLDQLWMDKVEFVYRSAEGVVYGTQAKSEFEYWQDAGISGAVVNDMERAHVWRGTHKEFTPWIGKSNGSAPTAQV